MEYPFIAAFQEREGESAEGDPNDRENKPQWKIYHIPSGRLTHVLPERDLAIGKGGNFAFEQFEKEGEAVFQAVSHPFDPARRAFFFQRPAKEICAQGLSADRTLAYAAARPGGGFFVFDTKQGRMIRHFVKECPHHISHVSGNSFVFHLWDEAEQEQKEELKIFEELRLPARPQSSLSGAEAALQGITAAREALTEETFPFLTAALESGLESRRPRLIAKSLWSALLRSPDLYLDLLSRWPHLTDLRGLDEISAAAMLGAASHEEIRPYLTAALSLLKLTVSETRSAGLSGYGFLRPLLPLLKALTPGEAALYREKITVSLANGAASSIPLLGEVFQSKLYYAAKGHVDELFGLPREPVSDITLARTKPPAPLYGPAAYSLTGQRGPSPVFTEAFQIIRGSSETMRESPLPPPAKKTKEDKWGKPLGGIAAVILASDPIEGIPGAAAAADFGIHYAVAKEARVSYQSADPEAPLLNETVEWRIRGGASYRAKILARVKEEGLRFAAIPSGPDYESVWADGRMAGAMAVGSSLRTRSRPLLKEYYSYFRERGFVFSAFETRDLKRFLLEKIAGCGIDYFLKESHSDGDERNVFRLRQNSRILHGRLPMGNGRAEEIYLIFPKIIDDKEKIRPAYGAPADKKPKSREKTALLSSAELAEAVARREKRQCGEITYFNTSCWAHVKARYEMETVNSPAFINIPAISYSDTFQNHKDSAIRALLDSYRGGQDFKGFREAMRGLSKAAVNRYIFPDELLYQEEILARIQAPLDIDIALERRPAGGGEWRAIAPDEAL